MGDSCREWSLRMTDVRTSADSDPQRGLTDILEDVRRGLAELVEQIPAQETIIESGDVKAIQQLLDRRNEVIEQMTTGTQGVPALLASCDSKDPALELIAGIEELLSSLLEADRQGARSIERHRSSLQKQLGETRAASAAAQVYQGASTAPPAARFSDRKV